MKVKKDILSVVRKNIEREKANTFYTELMASTLANSEAITSDKSKLDHMENIIDIR